MLSVNVKCFVDHCLYFCPISFGHCSICPSIYGFLLSPLVSSILFSFISICVSWPYSTILVLDQRQSNNRFYGDQVFRLFRLDWIMLLCCYCCCCQCWYTSRTKWHHSNEWKQHQINNCQIYIYLFNKIISSALLPILKNYETWYY